MPITFMYVFYATVKIKKRLLELVLLLFNQIVTYCLAKMKTDTIILLSDVETVKLQLYSNTFLDIFPSVTGESIIRRKKSYYTSFDHHLETQTSLSSLFRCFGSLGDGELQVMVMERIEKSLGCQIMSMH